MQENNFIYVISRFYTWFIRFFSNWQSIFLFLLRITWGHQFFLTGLGKLHKIEATTTFFQSLGIPLPVFSAWIVSLFELIGGICLFCGFASRFFSLFLSIIMFMAYSTAHAHIFSGFAFVFTPSLLAQQAPFPFLITSLIVLFFGPGKISFDGWIKKCREKSNLL